MLSNDVSAFLQKLFVASGLQKLFVSSGRHTISISRNSQAKLHQTRYVAKMTTKHARLTRVAHVAVTNFQEKSRKFAARAEQHVASAALESKLANDDVEEVCDVA
jgi:hypothetical protein